MSKITFRADDDLVRQLEEFDASKSEVMREALREFLGEAEATPSDGAEPSSDGAESVDELIVERVDTVLEERLSDVAPRRDPSRRDAQDVNVNISLSTDGAAVDAASDDASGSRDRTSREGGADVSHASAGRKTEGRGRDDAVDGSRTTCGQCGDEIGSGHVYCPNCGEKASRRVFCECGDELRSDWSFCPGCGRRTPAADVLDQAGTRVNEG